MAACGLEARTPGALPCPSGARLLSPPWRERGNVSSKQPSMLDTFPLCARRAGVGFLSPLFFFAAGHFPQKLLGSTDRECGTEPPHSDFLRMKHFRPRIFPSQRSSLKHQERSSTPFLGVRLRRVRVLPHDEGKRSPSPCRSAGFQPAWRPGWPPSQAGSPSTFTRNQQPDVRPKSLFRPEAAVVEAVVLTGDLACHIP